MRIYAAHDMGCPCCHSQAVEVRLQENGELVRMDNGRHWSHIRNFPGTSVEELNFLERDGATKEVILRPGLDLISIPHEGQG